VTSDTRLAEVITALEAVGLSSLVMGGHAVRYYGNLPARSIPC